MTQPAYGAVPGPYSNSSPPPPTSRPPRNPLGVASLIVGAILTAISFLVGLGALVPQIYGEYDTLNLIFTARTVIVGLLGLVAIGLGIAALMKKDAGKAAAGAGTALGAIGVLDLIAGLLTPLIVALL